MDPVTMAALISAGSMLVGGLMQSKAQKEEAKRARVAAAQQMAFTSRANAEKSMADNEQKAFDSLMQGYGKALL